MNESNDITNLFKHFDGDPLAYQESGLSNDALYAKSRWPLLAAIDLSSTAAPEPVVREREAAALAAAAARAAQLAAAAAEAAPVSRAQFVAPRPKVLSTLLPTGARSPAGAGTQAAKSLDLAPSSSTQYASLSSEDENAPLAHSAEAHSRTADSTASLFKRF